MTYTEVICIINFVDIECAPSPFGLMLSCLCTHNAHIFISSLSTLVRLWGKEKETTSLGLDMIKFFGNFSLDARSKKDFIKVQYSQSCIMKSPTKYNVQERKTVAWHFCFEVNYNYYL